jgi:ABC-2 type transport system permease protein
MTTLAADRPSPSAIRQWWVLTIRVIAPTIRSGEVFVAIGLSIAFTASLYIPLKQIMGAVVHGSYAQWIMPSICLQAVYFAAMSGALRSATDSVHGINRRLASCRFRPPRRWRRACRATCTAARLRSPRRSSAGM